MIPINKPCTIYNKRPKDNNNSPSNIRRKYDGFCIALNDKICWIISRNNGFLYEESVDVVQFYEEMDH